MATGEPWELADDVVQDWAAERRRAETAEFEAECAYDMAGEAWALVAKLVDMAAGRAPIDRDLIAKLDEHREHVEACRAGSCAHEYAALVHAGIVSAPARLIHAAPGRSPR